jgi:hypothetical protein
MAIRILHRHEWKDFFDRVTGVLLGKQADIEVASLALGDQIETESMQVLGIVYDPKNDLIEIVLDGLDHLIHRPRELYVDENGVELTSMQIVDADGTRQIVKLKDPLMLPAPTQASQGK